MTSNTNFLDEMDVLLGEVNTKRMLPSDLRQAVLEDIEKFRPEVIEMLLSKDGSVARWISQTTYKRLANRIGVRNA